MEKRVGTLERILVHAGTQVQALTRVLQAPRHKEVHKLEIRAMLARLEVEWTHACWEDLTFSEMGRLVDGDACLHRVLCDLQLSVGMPRAENCGQ